LKRAGLDYWHLLKLHYHDSFADVQQAYPDRRFYYNTTKAHSHYSAVSYEQEDMLVFGKETAGLPESLLAANREYCIRIPMIEAARSLNLSNAVAVVLYEALRQNGFATLT
jgi:tRNA (cytidine/uridine-2'-O-)-methyltransferase